MSIYLDLTDAARENVAETGADVDADVAGLLSGEWTRETLLAHCMVGADADRVEGWEEYVSQVVAAASERAEREIDAALDGDDCGDIDVAREAQDAGGGR